RKDSLLKADSFDMINKIQGIDTSGFKQPTINVDSLENKLIQGGTTTPTPVAPVLSKKERKKLKKQQKKDQKKKEEEEKLKKEQEEKDKAAKDAADKASS